MILKVGLLLGLAMLVKCSEDQTKSEQRIVPTYGGHHGELIHIGHHEPVYHDSYASAYPSYEFSYHVDDPHTHDNKGHHEVRDGDRVSGSYWLMQPDGRRRIVRYHADHATGFHADVQYEPHTAVHPAEHRHEVSHERVVPHVGNHHDIPHARRYDGYELQSYRDDHRIENRPLINRHYDDHGYYGHRVYDRHDNHILPVPAYGHPLP